MVRIKSLQHIGILVPDAEEAARWYIGKSGFLKKAEFMASGNMQIHFPKTPAPVRFLL